MFLLLCVGRGYEEFVPLYRRRTPSRITELPLFPCYVFCRFDAQNRFPVVSIPGVFSIVGRGGIPEPIAEQEVADLKKVIHSGLSRQPWPHFKAGQRVVVRAGPLAGVEGIFIGFKNSGRLIISVSLLQRAVAVEIDSSWIAAC